MFSLSNTIRSYWTARVLDFHFLASSSLGQESEDFVQLGVFGLIGNYVLSVMSPNVQEEKSP